MNITTLTNAKSFINIEGTDYDTLLTSYIVSTSMQFERYLERHLKVMERTERYILFPNQKTVHVNGFPIELDSDALPKLIVYDANNSVISDDNYDVYTSERDQGKVIFYNSYNFITKMSMTYTGGMAYDTEDTTITGTTGSSNEYTFTDLNATFITDQVVYGDTLTIDSTEYRIVGPTSETELVILDIMEEDTDLSYTITKPGIITKYPDLQLACLLQVLMLYKQKDKVDVASSSVGGQSVSYTKFRPIDLLPESKSILDSYKLQTY